MLRFLPSIRCVPEKSITPRRTSKSKGLTSSPSGAPYASPGEVDRAGVRIGVSSNSAYDLFLRRALKHAELVHAGSPAEAFELLASGATDVLAGVRQHLAANSKRLPGSRVLDQPS